MSSLLGRLEAATTRPAPATSRPRLLPLSSLRQRLEEHALVHGLGNTCEEVHAALVEVDRLHQTREALKRSTVAAATEATRATTAACAHCGHTETSRIDAKEGVRVCDLCGLVVQHGINVHVEYQPRPPPPSSSSARTRDDQRREPMDSRLQSDEPHRCHSSLWDELQHWNFYAGLSHESLEDADEDLVQWTATSHRHPARVAAVLLHRILSLPDTEAILERVRLKRPLPMARGPPEPEFECPSCKVRKHTLRDARYHCRMRLGARRHKRLL